MVKGNDKTKIMKKIIALMLVATLSYGFTLSSKCNALYHNCCNKKIEQVKQNAKQLAEKDETEIHPLILISIPFK